MELRARLVVVLVAALGAVACHKPDLTIDSGPLRVDLAGTGVPGGSLRLSAWRLTNRGSARARSSYGVVASGYYLSPDPAVTTSDRALKGLVSVDLDELGPGQSHDFPGDQQIVIPEDVQPGTYYFGVIVDSNDGVEESDEANNVAVVRIGVVRAPD
jgi:hypothetical protein